MMTLNHSLMIPAALGLAIAIPTAAVACSKINLRATRAPNEAHFLGTPTADTILSGPGSVRYVIAQGHSGPAGARAIFGQVVSVERIGGLASRALGAPVTRVVLVPWDYGADCTPTPWTGSASWATPERGLFTAILRDSAHWAGGLPTFDVFTPAFEPYREHMPRRALAGEGASETMVPMDELFELMELFPDRSLLRDSAESATAALFAWARANPELARRQPIPQALALARNSVGRQRLGAIRSPITGTWRMSVAISDGEPRTFYARTREQPVRGWHYSLVPRPVDDPTVVPRPDGYSFLAAVGQSPDMLPRNCEEDRNIRREGYMDVVFPPSDSSGVDRWVGKLERSLVERAFPGDSAVRRISRTLLEESSRRARARLPNETPARYERSPDGTIRVEQTLSTADGQSIRITGTRVSSDVIACRW